MPETKDITVKVNLNDTDFWMKLGRLISAFQKQAEELAARFSEQAVALQGMADSLKEMEANMPDTIHVYEDDAKEFRWKRVAPNGEIVSDSAEGYDSPNGAIDAANREAEGTDAIVKIDTGSDGV